MAHYASGWSTRAIRKCRTIKPYETQHRLKYERPRGHQASATLRKHSTTTIRCLSCTEREAVKDPKRSVSAAWGGGEGNIFPTRPRPSLHAAAAAATTSMMTPQNKRSVSDREPLVSLVYGRKWVIPASFVAETSMRARDKDSFRWRSVPPEDRMGDSSVKSSKRHELAAVSCHVVMYVSGVVTPPQEDVWLSKGVSWPGPLADGLLWTSPSCCVRVSQWSGKISRRQIENLRGVLR
ncbi:hypothetical protein GE21DRAFT_4378 [Neurospora crassa]|uniref:Uncharacterized protein n=1 Tax=Neurospora crassa (strain ATCC 24698 / 74-OR23-1A / CBS 708.71 / DSM 1257 / FGSC 987) TaxID=367110 RepID=Q7RYN2_NEUCR|nr:hypothetical protein NCU00096 [Neurospora crassa OR74A]EAA27984.1 hypothetical protein NCU00096 [Neurospora crassa OR74A]KHE89511.1 hypothetical protein GE21DRAFT_4378 [Neurospora crassa]|eukprot:XP_957220.1 hypothetical protein NCU00096 [Neurospora crassa OR74A]